MNSQCECEILGIPLVRLNFDRFLSFSRFNEIFGRKWAIISLSCPKNPYITAILGYFSISQTFPDWNGNMFSFSRYLVPAWMLYLKLYWPIIFSYHIVVHEIHTTAKTTCRERKMILTLWMMANFSCFCCCLFVCFIALRPKSTAMVIAGRSVHLTTLFPGQAWTSS